MLSKLLRIKQWIKNAFIFFPLIFSGNLFDINRLLNCVVTFVGFCLIASGTYIFNDHIDSHKDRLHPKKASRPLAQGKFKNSQIIGLIVGLLSLGLLICFVVDIFIFYMGVLYILLHLIYNLYTKKIVILDVVFVAAGFQLRIWAGALASGVLPSARFQLCVFLLALFLGFTKRRHEITTLKDQAPEHRSVLAHYTTYLLDQIIIICSTLSIVFYGLYTLSADIMIRVGQDYMIYSVGFVIYGIFRYLYLVHVKKFGDDPGEILLSDRPLLINIILWILFVIMILYLSNPL